MTFAEWLALVPRLLSLVSALVALYRSHLDRGLGRAQAAAAALILAEAEIRAANEAKHEANRAHAEHASDAAFDQDFRRAD